MLHNKIQPIDNHGIIRWQVADNAELNALVLAPEDIGKVARVAAPAQLLVLLDDVGPEWSSLLSTGSNNASDINVVDAGGYYVGDNVEAVLQEIGSTLSAQTKQVIAIAVSDETSDLTAGVAKVGFHIPYNFDLSEVIAGLNTAQGSGAILTFDINVNGPSILSTKLTVDNTEVTSITAAIPAVLSSTALNKGDKITVDIDQVGAAGADGAKVYLIGKVRP